MLEVSSSLDIYSPMFCILLWIEDPTFTFILYPTGNVVYYFKLLISTVVYAIPVCIVVQGLSLFQALVLYVIFRAQQTGEYSVIVLPSPSPGTS